jgi:hypothetical protein
LIIFAVITKIRVEAIAEGKFESRFIEEFIAIKSGWTQPNRCASLIREAHSKRLVLSRSNIFRNSKSNGRSFGARMMTTREDAPVSESSPTRAMHLIVVCCRIVAHPDITRSSNVNFGAVALEKRRFK